MSTSKVKIWYGVAYMLYKTVTESNLSQPTCLSNNNWKACDIHETALGGPRSLWLRTDTCRGNTTDKNDDENYAYRSAGFVVMQVHFLPQCLPSFTRIDELPTEPKAKAYIVTASPPFPNSDV